MKMKLRQVRLLAIVLTLVLIAGIGGFWLGNRTAQNSSGQNFWSAVKQENNQKVNLSLFFDVWNRLETTFIDKKSLNAHQMIYGAIKGMVASLNDPYTVFLPPSDNQQAKEDLNGSFGGVGIELGYQDHHLTVIAPLPGMPAKKAGVKAGDLILKIDDKTTEGMSLPKAVTLIRGIKGTQVKLTLQHAGQNTPYEAKISRETIIIPSVKVKFINGVAWLQLMRFGDRTDNEWNQAVSKILQHRPPIKGIILDLRGNPGGYLTSSIFVASEFLKKGVVVQQESANGNRQAFSVNRKGKLTDYNLLVLVNRGSASASEIVAGALHDYKRAKLVGEKTFGKGTIQEAEELSDGSGLHITTARWLLPSGASINQKGIKPDYEVKNNPKTKADEQLDTAVKMLLK